MVYRNSTSRPQIRGLRTKKSKKRKRSYYCQKEMLHHTTQTLGWEGGVQTSRNDLSGSNTAWWEATVPYFDAATSPLCYVLWYRVLLVANPLLIEKIHTTHRICKVTTQHVCQSMGHYFRTVGQFWICRADSLDLGPVTCPCSHLPDSSTWSSQLILLITFITVDSGWDSVRFE